MFLQIKYFFIFLFLTRNISGVPSESELIDSFIEDDDAFEKDISLKASCLRLLFRLDLT
jgi:hypothetical protein